MAVAAERSIQCHQHMGVVGQLLYERCLLVDLALELLYACRQCPKSCAWLVNAPTMLDMWIRLWSPDCTAYGARLGHHRIMQAA